MIAFHLPFSELAFWQADGCIMNDCAMRFMVRHNMDEMMASVFIRAGFDRVGF